MVTNRRGPQVVQNAMRPQGARRIEVASRYRLSTFCASARLRTDVSAVYFTANFRGHAPCEPNPEEAAHSASPASLPRCCPPPARRSAAPWRSVSSIFGRFWAQSGSKLEPKVSIGGSLGGSREPFGVTCGQRRENDRFWTPFWCQNGLKIDPQMVKNTV